MCTTIPFQHKGGQAMRTIQSEMSRHGISKARYEDRQKSKCRPPKKMKEQFSQRELEDLMGMRRDTYYRKNGSVRSR